MAFKYFLHNDEILPLEQAVVPLSRVEYSYGFGAYETIRVNNGSPLFIGDHCKRLMISADIIGLEHGFNAGSIKDNVIKLIKQNEAQACNIKILLIGGDKKDLATLDILCLNPLYVDRKLYSNGAKVITYNYERDFPGSKTLNMLPSYLAYREALRSGAYDAILINRLDCITEGTRTNFFGLKGRQLFSPPVDKILPGISRAHVIEIATQNGFKVTDQTIKLSEINEFDSLFLTSTSTKILPVNQVNGQLLNFKNGALKELIHIYDEFLERHLSQ
jgi:branched-chain amino acid aminotransferase